MIPSPHTTEYYMKLQAILKNKFGSRHHLNLMVRGLETGIPDLSPASKAHSALLRANKFKEARALEGIVCNSSWCGERIHKAFKDKEIVNISSTGNPDPWICAR